jgi:hypothetical protein
MSLRDQMMAALQLRMQQQQQQDASALANAQHQPIPGLTGPTSSGGIPGQPTVGMAPPQQPLPSPGMGTHMFQPAGPYGQQAAQMAGLLGGGTGAPGIPGAPPGVPGSMGPAVGGQQINALLGNKSRNPFYRPVGK